jgi:hypothetical protein
LCGCAFAGAYIDGFFEGSYFLAAVAELEKRDESERQLERQNHLRQKKKVQEVKVR